MKLWANQLRCPYLSASMNGGYTSFRVWLKRSSSWGALRARAHLHQSPSCRCLGECQEHGLLVSAKAESPRITDFQLFSSAHSQQFETITDVNGYNIIPLPRLRVLLTRVRVLGANWNKTFRAWKGKMKACVWTEIEFGSERQAENILVGCDKFKAD